MNLNYLMKAFSGAMLMLTPFLSAEAATLTPEQALNRVKGSSTQFRMPGTSSYRLAHTESTAGEPRLYVFNTGNDGFIITSADDAFPALLGYSDCGAFDPSDASPELRWWLGQYADEATWFMRNPVEFAAADSRKKAPEEERPNIPELLTTKWDQMSPFNLDCPEDYGGRSVTGCVATAMAQVIKYHAYPVQGSGEHSYNWYGRTLSFDYGSTVFNFADMLDVYDWNATPEQQQAVASLMYACGVSVNMNYTSNESEASDMYIPYALKTYFNYDAGVRLLQRNFFNTEQWEDMVYEELAAGRPVIYGGKAEKGGHQFVCDGYENGYFHINWGWSGMGNGFFLLSALDPGIQGVGGFAGGYNSKQTMIAGAMPNEGGTPWYPLYATGSMEVNQVNPFQAYVNFQTGGFFNYSPEPVTVNFYLKAVSETGEEFMSETPQEVPFGAAVGNNVSGYGGIPVFIPQNLAAGNYRVTVGFITPEGNWQDILFPLSQVAYANLSVGEDGSYLFTMGNPMVKTKIRATVFAPETTVISGVPTLFNLTVENIGEIEFSNVITVRVFEKDSHVQPLAESRMMLDIAVGQVFNGYYELTYHLPPGEYDVIVFDQYYEVVSDVIPLSVGRPPVEVERITLDMTDAWMEPDSTLQLTATVLPEDADDKSLVWSSSDPEVANVDQEGLVTAFNPGRAIITVRSAANEDISISCQVTVEPKVIYVGSITLDKTEITAVEGDSITLVATVLPADATDRTLVWSSSDEEVATVDQAGVVTVLKEGTAIITATAADGSDIKAECVVTGISGVEEIMMGAAKADVYSVSGVLLKAGADAWYISSLGKGTYIIRTATKATKIIK